MILGVFEILLLASNFSLTFSDILSKFSTTICITIFQLNFTL